MLFDLYGTLGYAENPVSDDEAADYLFSRGYEVSRNSLGQHGILWPSWIIQSMVMGVGIPF
ncbi:MAG: hypothetical protein ACUVTB_04475 [Candidatus Bathycorpusculaceae bacterium]